MVRHEPRQAPPYRRRPHRVLVAALDIAPQRRAGRSEDMVAAVIELDGPRTIEVDRLPVERRKELIEWLAQNWLTMPPEATEVLLTAWCRRQPHLEDAWHGYLVQRDRADAVDHGIPDWDWLCGDCGHGLVSDCGCLCCPTASEIAHQDADAALAVLIGSAR